MCRNIHTLFNYEPEATAEEIHDAALQYVRKISGFTKPSQANAEAISTSEIRISVVCRDTDVPAAVRAVHEAFELGAAEGETATVYGGTGR